MAPEAARLPHVMAAKKNTTPSDWLAVDGNEEKEEDPTITHVDGTAEQTTVTCNTPPTHTHASLHSCVNREVRSDGRNPRVVSHFVILSK